MITTSFEARQWRHEGKMPDEGLSPSPGAPASAPANPASPSAEQPKTDGVAPAEPAAKPRVAPISPEAEQRQQKSRQAAAAKPSLPGLVDNRNDSLGDLLPPRDQNGKFISREEAEAAAERELFGEPEPKPAQPATAPAKPNAPAAPPSAVNPPAAGTKKFAGSYNTVEELEQAHKSLQGQYKAFDATRSELVKERDTGIRTAWEWKNEHDKVVSKLTALEKQIQGGGSNVPASTGRGQDRGVGGPSAGGANTAATATMPTVEEMLSGDVGSTFEALAVRNGLPDAGKFLASATLKTVMDRVVPALREELRKEIQAPAQQAKQEQQAVDGIRQTLESVAALKLPGGAEAFPEVKDSAKLAQIAKMWIDSGHRAEDAYTANGLISAIALHRMMSGFIAPSSPSGVPVVTPSPAAPAAGAGPAASLDASGQHSVLPNDGRSNVSLSPGARALVAGLKMNEPMIDKTLGFARNRRN